ncbi:TetR/AcrR family transcriptional regulator [Allonocardiopsis opalescens]|uniref:TetR family transcriptional regulator n=1 Tax=Allonocardiopsis opalescens TaxID=1144618 RepID=A0A2T0QA98_9ACTN|nr:TetR family transcriptional regulator [Allonocardiopsis opalescens]PRY00799.1 TetR family transcriptional regulator [Allonocardiopsis opalescens]
MPSDTPGAFHRDADADAGGRPPVRDRALTRRRILDAARDLFTREEYGAVSSRAIAAAAGVNVALINRYFGSKLGLLREVVAEEAAFPRIFEGDRAGLPRRLARHMVERTHGGGSPLLRALNRSSADPDLKAVFRERLDSALVGPLRERLDGPEAELRAELAVTFLVGASTLRQIHERGGLADYDPQRLEDRLTGVLAACLGEEPSGG